MNEKKCLKCKRIVVGKRKLGLCPKCFDSLGTKAAAGAGIALMFVGCIFGVSAKSNSSKNL